MRNFLAFVHVPTVYLGGEMPRFGFDQSWCSACARAAGACSALLVCAILTIARADEPGQTPKPKDTDPPPAVPEEEQVKLDKKLPYFDGVEDDAPFIYRGKKIGDAQRLNKANQEQKAYEYSLEFASRQPIERMRKYSIKDVPVENLYHERVHKDYLRDLLHFEGKVALVQTAKPTDDLQELSGIEQLYEVWVWPKGSSKLFCVVVSELPDGLRVGEDQEKWVAFDAYYFKLWHYESRRKKDDKSDPDKRQWEKAPLFLGKTVELIPDPMPASTTYSPLALFGVIAGLATICAVAFLVTLWFRRGDRHVRSQARQKIEAQATFDNIPDLAGPAERSGDQSFPV